MSLGERTHIDCFQPHTNFRCDKTKSCSSCRLREQRRDLGPPTLSDARKVAPLLLSSPVCQAHTSPLRNEVA